MATETHGAEEGGLVFHPMDQFIGVWWSGHDADLALVGEASKGYKSISWSMPQHASAGFRSERVKSRMRFHCHCRGAAGCG